MAVSALTEIEIIRDKTGVTTTQVSDDKINQYRLEYLNLERWSRIYMICADMFDFLSKSYPAGTVRIGEQELSNIDLLSKATEYRKRARAKDVFIV